MDFVDIVNAVVMFIILIGILVTIHEFGHFIAARMTGMRVDIFSIGMGKRLFGFNSRNGFTYGDLPDDWEGDGITDYRIAVLPIGGYVKIAGMIDESMDTEHLASEPQPWEFRSKGSLAKFLTISAGVILNWFLAVVVFAAIAFFPGIEVNPTSTIGYVTPGSVAEKAGLRTGDEIRTVNDERPETWKDVEELIFIRGIGDDKKVELIRDGQRLVLDLDGATLAGFVERKQAPGILPDNLRVVVNEVVSDRAQQLGLAAGDTIIQAGPIRIYSTVQLSDYVTSRPGETITLVWKTGGETKSGQVLLDENGHIGIKMSGYFDGRQETYSFFASLAYGWEQTVGTCVSFVDQIGQIFKGKLRAQDSLGGPIEIAKMAGQSFQVGGFWSFLNFLAMLSVILAIINILPIPALDGGHLVFIIVEAVMRREVPTKLKMSIQYVGMVLLLGLMAVVFGFDIMRNFFN